MSDNVKIVCTFKTGGDYTDRYVMLLFNQLLRHAQCEFTFYCNTDSHIAWVGGLEQRHRFVLNRLQHPRYLPSWWSKLEAYYLTGPVIAFDLDTVIVNDITTLVQHALTLPPDEICFLRDFRGVPWNSSIVIRNGDFRWVTDAIVSDVLRGRYKKDKRGVHLRIADKEFHGDQDWTTDRLQKHKIKIGAIQDRFDGIYSYKDDIAKRTDFPDDARIICFHGRPRPHTLKPTPQWMVNAGW